MGTGAEEQLARSAGADEVLHHDSADIAVQARKLTGMHGANVSYDGVGAATFGASLASPLQRWRRES